MSTRVRAAGVSTVLIEHQARIVHGATPRFASQLSHKDAQLNVRAVQGDLAQNHGRMMATSYIQNVADDVSSIIATAKEERWEYAPPRLEASIATVVISLDGAMIPMADSAGYREAMAGSSLVLPWHCSATGSTRTAGISYLRRCRHCLAHVAP
jgi:hypothetical protein